MILPLVLLWSVLSSGLASGQEPPADPDRRPVTLRHSVEWISAIRVLDPAASRLNPGNGVLALPQFRAQTELRPNLRVELGSRTTVIVRPRLVAAAESSWAEGRARQDAQETSANVTELYLNYRPTDVLQLTYGLQNYQWGPAELMSPSNRLFHEVGVFRDAIYYVRGRHLARVNVSAGRQWSLVALAELGDNGERDFNTGQPFRRQGQAKLEYTVPSGASYVGLTVGARDAGRSWFGEYASLALTEGLSAYVDAVHRRGSDAWYPVHDASGRPSFARRDAGSTRWRALGVAGLRYTLVSGADVRAEVMHQDGGYSSADMRLAAEAVLTTRSVAALAAYTAPGLELLGRRLALLSVRVPDLPPTRHLVLQGRYLRSLSDRSGVVFTTMSLEAAEALVLFGSVAVTHGRDVAEFSRLARTSVTAGAVWTW